MRRLLATLALLVVALGAVAPAASAETGPPAGRVLRVPADFPTIEAAIDASTSGDMILLAPGVYPGDVEVSEDHPGITIRGENRNTVVFDGQDERANAIDVEADGVTLENMSAHNFRANGFYWDGVEGFAGRYLTVWNVGLYGIYAISSRGGIMEESFVSGAGDAAFYIGECNPCDATVRNVTATLSALGYSGTNAGGNLVVEDSKWLLNYVGILPNSFDVGLEPPPQRDAIFRRNEVVGSGTVVTPRVTPLGAYHGVGIGIAGGLDNLVVDNDVRGSTRYGIAVFTAVDQATQWHPSGNDIEGNRVSDSGIADLALGGNPGPENCFRDNEVATSAPAGLEGGCALPGTSDAAAAAALAVPLQPLLRDLPDPPSYTEMAAPGDQPTMPLEPVDPGSPQPSPGASGAPAPSSATSEPVLLAAIVVIVAVFAVVIVLVAFRAVRGRPSTP